MSKRYVQHRSGDGEKWRIDAENKLQWGHHPSKEVLVSTYWLPKSEYIICEPPEVWKDVTDEVEFSDFHNHLNLSPSHAMAGQYVPFMLNYRLRKVPLAEWPQKNVSQGWAFVVERKEP